MKRLIALLTVVAALMGCTKDGVDGFKGWWICETSYGTVPNSDVREYRLLYFEGNSTASEKGSGKLHFVYSDPNAWDAFNKQYEKLTGSKSSISSVSIVSAGGSTWYQASNTKTKILEYAINDDGDELVYVSTDKKSSDFLKIKDKKIVGYKRIK